MKSIKLKVAKEKIYSPGSGEIELIFRTVDMLRDVANDKPASGIAISEMMQRLKILGISEKHRKDFELPEGTLTKDVSEEFLNKTIIVKYEDEDYKALKEWVKNMRWGILSNFIVEFVNDFK